jgi:hypothetical protein
MRALVALLVLVGLAGCAQTAEDDAASVDDDSSATVGDIDLGGGDALETGSAAERSDEGSGGEGDGEAPIEPVGGSPLTASGRQFISTAELGVEVDDVSEATQRAIRVVEGKGGALFGESSTYEGEPQAVLTLKVPPADFATTLRELGELGTVVSQTVDTQDVTERVVDLESRIETASTSVNRLQGFLGGAGSVADVAAFEAELVARETELETLRAQLRTLEAQIDLATIVLTVRAEGDDRNDEAEEEDDLPGFVDGLRGGWEAFVDAGTVSLAVVGAVLPWLPVVLLLLVAVRLTRRFTRPPTFDDAPPTFTDDRVSPAPAE